MTLHTTRRTIYCVRYPAFSVPPAAGQSQIEPTRALANRRKPRHLTHKVLIQVDTILL